MDFYRRSWKRQGRGVAYTLQEYKGHQMFTRARRCQQKMQLTVYRPPGSLAAPAQSRSLAARFPVTSFHLGIYRFRSYLLFQKGYSASCSNKIVSRFGTEEPRFFHSKNSIKHEAEPFYSPKAFIRESHFEDVMGLHGEPRRCSLHPVRASYPLSH